MKTAEAYLRPHAGDTGQDVSPEEFETLRHLYYVKNEQYIPAVRRLVEQGQLDRQVLTNLGKVQRAHIEVGTWEENDLGESFVSADEKTDALSVLDEGHLPHEATHLLGRVAWRPLNEGMTQLIADKLAGEMNVEEISWLYEEEKRLARNVVRLAGFDITPGSDLEDVNWARLSRIFCGDDPEENFNELNMLVRRRTGTDTLAEMRNLQDRNDYSERAKQKRVGEPQMKDWEDLNSSERLKLEVQEINAVLEAPIRRLQQKTSRPLGQTAGRAAGRYRGGRRKPKKFTRLFSRLAS